MLLLGKHDVITLPKLGDENIGEELRDHAALLGLGGLGHLMTA